MANVPSLVMTPDYQQQRSVDLRWMPKDCDGQIKLGFSIIANAFKSKVKALEEDLRATHDDKTELEGKLGVMVQKLQKLERESLEVSLIQSKLTEVEERLIEKTAELETRTSEFLKKEREMIEDNKRLALNIKSLKRKANQLDAFRRIVVETITKEDEFPANDCNEKQQPQGPIKPSTNRVAVGTEFQSRDRDLDFQSASQNSESEGRRLFRHARSTLSVDRFEQFLELVRGLNAHAITVEEALKEVELLCGYDNSGLFEEFKTLMSCSRKEY